MSCADDLFEGVVCAFEGSFGSLLSVFMSITINIINLIQLQSALPALVVSYISSRKITQIHIVSYKDQYYLLHHLK
jgi:hypothetical protein